MMWPILRLLMITGICRFVSINASEAQQDYSIDDVLLLNREFLDYLVTFNESMLTPLELSMNHQCVMEVQQLAKGYLNRDRYGLEWFDSWGKIPSGLYYENPWALGNFDQCKQFNWNGVRGQYCTFAVGYPGDMGKLITGLCMPRVCVPEFVEKLYGWYLETKGARMLPLYLPEWMCVRERELEFNGATVVAIVMFTAVAVVVVLSTAYECRQLWLSHLVNPLYSSFSLYRNMKSILHINPRSPNNSDMIDCVHGLRGICMIWVLAVHVQEALGQIPIDNSPVGYAYLDSFTAAIFNTTGYLTVDTFLVLSGMLVAMNLLRQLDAKGRLNPLKLYLHRYIRITGPFAALILFTVSFATYMGEGPQWNSIGDFRDACMENWWSALLHVQNYVNPSRMCLPWSWYLSVDMQLYILAPAVIYPLWRYGERVLIVIASLAVLSMASVFITFIVKDYRYSYIDSSGDGLRYDSAYFPTHTRMATWLWGIIFGYYLYKIKTYGMSVPKWIWSVGWVIPFIIFVMIVSANYILQRPDFDQYPQVLDAIYESLHRSVFAVALMFVILACVSGKAGVINEFLSAPLWQPLSRLSFTVYLLHVLLFMMSSVASSKTSAHFSMMDLFYRIWGAIGITASVALPWSAIFEVPFITIDKLLLRNKYPG